MKFGMVTHVGNMCACKRSASGMPSSQGRAPARLFLGCYFLTPFDTERPNSAQ